MITVVNKRTHEPCGADIYIGNPSVFQNPWSATGVGSRGNAIEYIEYYKIRIADALKLRSEHRMWKSLSELVKMEAEGKEIHLVCWCKPNSCHGDVLKEVVEKLARLYKKHGRLNPNDWK